MLDQDQLEAGKDPSAPTLRELAMVFFRQRKTFLWVAGVIFLLSLVYAVFGASYRAQVRVLVRRGRFDPPVAAQQNAPFDFSRAEVTEEELNSEVELLKDDDVLLRVVKSTDLAAHDWLVGDRFTAADINVAEVVRYAQSHPTLLGEFPPVKAWLERCQSRPAFQTMWQARAAEPA